MSGPRCWNCWGPESDGPDGLCWQCRLAQAGEAGTAEAVEQDSVHEHAVGNADAHNDSGGRDLMSNDDLSPKERVGDLIEYLDAVGDTCFVVGGRRVYADDLRAVWKAADTLACTVKRIYAEQLPDTWFVCGESTVKDRNGLPAHIHVCPAYGVSWTQLYERVDRKEGE